MLAPVAQNHMWNRGGLIADHACASSGLRALVRSAPLRQLDGDSVGARHEDEVAVVEAFELAARLDTVRAEVGDHRVDVIDGEADVVEAELVETGDGGVAHCRRVAIVQKLDLEPR